MTRVAEFLATRLAAVLLVVVGGASCAKSMRFFEVVRTPTKECDIFPQGDFCDQLSAPQVEVYGVDVREQQTFLYFEEEVWIADGVEGARTVDKQTVVTRDPGPCTTTTTRSITFSVEPDPAGGPDLFVGTSIAENRLEGPQACGETPRGDSHAYALSGPEVGNP